MSSHPQNLINESPMNGAQVLAVAICVMLTALDGFDILSISFAAPGIAADWGIDRAALGIVLSMELVGMAVGSILLGSVADRVGRRPTIMLCLVLMATGMFFAAQATGMVDMSIHRLYTGLGIGGMLASTNAMAAEFSNNKHRDFSVMLMAAGYPVGVIIGGTIASVLLSEYTWRSVFYFGSAVTVMFLPIVWFGLPESIDYLSNKGSPDALQRINSTLKRLKKQTVDALPEAVATTKINALELFKPHLLKTTIALTTSYFLHIITLYFLLKWIPKIVFDMGFTASEAGGVLVWANVGGLTGSVLLGLLSHRFSVKSMLLGVMVVSGIMIVVFGREWGSLAQLSMIAAAAGFFINSGVVGLYALFAKSFPVEVRAGGTGFAIGVGRGGAALSPAFAGFLFAFGYSLAAVSATIGLSSVLAAVALIFLKTQSASTQVTTPVTKPADSAP